MSQTLKLQIALNALIPSFGASKAQKVWMLPFSRLLRVDQSEENGMRGGDLQETVPGWDK